MNKIKKNYLECGFNMKLSIIIPCYNEKQTIARLISKVKQAILPANWTREIIIADDFSVDGTREILKNYQNDCIVVFKEQNGGKGSAIKAALPYVTGDYIIIQDGDLEYNPDNYEALLKPIVNQESKIVFGSRMLNKDNKPCYFFYYYGGWLLTKIFNLFFSTKLTDLATCYKIFPAELKNKLAELESNDFVYDVIELTRVVSLSGTIAEVSINYEPRSKKEGKKINWRHGLKCLAAIFKLRFPWLNFYKKLTTRHYLILIAATISLLVFLPIWQIGSNLNWSWTGVLPGYTDDALYYYTRLNEVGRGNFYLSNPYFLTYSNGPANLFILPDILAALPMLAGLTLVPAVVLNALFWGILCTFVIFILFKRLLVSNFWASIFSIIFYLQVYSLMLKPSVMQVIYALYAIFLLSFWQWIKMPNKKNSVILAISAVICFYAYPFLLLVAAAIIFLSFCWSIFFKKNEHTLSLLHNSWLALLLCLPFFIILFQLQLLPFHAESIERIGFINNRLPGFEAFAYGRWVILGLIIWTGTYYLSVKSSYKKEIQDLFVFFGITGTALLLAVFSNIFTGKDLDLGMHIGRFIMVWLLVCIFTAAYFFIKTSFLRGKQSFIVYSLIILIFLTTPFIIKNFYRSNPFINFDKKNSLEIQSFAEPLNFIDQYESQPTVIWSVNPSLNAYIPILTKHYVLFPSGGLHFHFFNAPSSEIKERYLVQNYFEDLNENNLKIDEEWYAGPGKVHYPIEAIKRQKYLCDLLNISKYNLCNNKRELTDYNILLNYYQKNIKNDLIGELKKFNVSYMILDKQNIYNLPKELNTKAIFNNENFVIYQIIYQ